MENAIREISIKHLAPTYYSRYLEAIRICNRKGLILNLGCKDDNLCRDLQHKKNKVVGCDIFFKKIENNYSKRISFVLGDGEKLPFKKNSFDIVICLDVLEHVENDEQALREISRVLKNNGQFILSSVNKNFPFTYDPINYLLKQFRIHVPIGIWGFGHKRLYDIKRLKKILQKNGFVVERVEFLTHFLAGFFENYISGILKPKSESKSIGSISTLVKYFLPITKLIVDLDGKLFRNDERSISILISSYKKVK